MREPTARQQAALPRLLYQPDDSAPSPGASRRLAGLGVRLPLEPFIKLARAIRRHQDGILNAIRLGLTTADSKASTIASASSATAATDSIAQARGSR